MSSDKEKVVLTKLEKRIMELAKEYPKGMSDKVVQNDAPEILGPERAAAVNHLVELGLLDLYVHGTTVLLKLTNQDEVDPLKNADAEEKVVYDLIKNAGNHGIWVRDIRIKSSLHPIQVKKVLKTLERKQLIKPVKSVTANKKEIYILFNIEPHRSVTGGPWYSDQEFDSDFVNAIHQACLGYLQDKLRSSYEKIKTDGPRVARMHAMATLSDISKFIATSKISQVPLSNDDIKCILETLIYDEKIDVIIKPDNKYYMAVHSFFDDSEPGLIQTPCGVCPVAKNCSSGGIVNPASCQYLDKWLNQLPSSSNTTSAIVTSSELD